MTAFYIKDGTIIAEYGVNEIQIAHLRNKYGFVEGTRLELVNAIKREEKRKAEWVKPYHGDLSTQEMDALQKEFAESMYTDEDRRIVEEIKKSRPARKKFYRHIA